VDAGDGVYWRLQQQGEGNLVVRELDGIALAAWGISCSPAQKQRYWKAAVSVCAIDYLTTLLSLHSPTYLTPYSALLQIKMPENVDIIKTATFKELPPLDADWFYTRCAAIARRVYINQGLGVGMFRKIFGGRNHAGGSHKRGAWEKSWHGVARITRLLLGMGYVRLFHVVSLDLSAAASFR
jgi:hypothetical protein